MAFDAQGNIYVVEQGNLRVQKFAPDRTFLAAWGGPGGEPGQFRDPTGVAVDGDGNVSVADIGNGRVQTFRLLPPLAPTGATPAA